MTNILNLNKQLYPSLSIARMQPQGIAIHSHSKIDFVDIAEIMYCQAEGNYCHIYTGIEQKITCTKTLKHLESQIKSSHFLRVHRSYLVNMKFLASFCKNDNCLALENGILIPVSRSATRHFFEWIDSQYVH